MKTNNNLVSSQIEGSKTRILLEIPEFDYFANLLHERLHAILYYYEEWDSRMMLLTNLYDRDPVRIQERREGKSGDVEALVYCGTKRQRIILEKEEPDCITEAKWNRKDWQLERNANWQALEGRIMDRSMENIETFPYFDKFRQNELGFSDVTVDALRTYFEIDKPEAERKLNELQQNELPIMSDYFDISKDKYIGIPLLGMGLFQGIVWLIFEDKEAERFNNPHFIRRIIKYFQVEYDNLVLDWDVAGENIKEESKVDEVFDRLAENNPIQKEIKLGKYYEILKYYHEERIRQSNDVVQNLKKQFAKTATITTLLDSYAHNISAHSLTALSWWFKEWAEYLDITYGGRKIIELLGRDTNPLIRLDKQMHDLAKTGSAPKQMLSRELATLFKFLLEKGAFWSGITRQTNFTGKISSLYSVLWYDFVNNPLYLGTIANTEQVGKLYLYISIYNHEDEIASKTFLNRKYIKKNTEGEFLDGTFAIVNLADFSIIAGNKNKESVDSVFIEKGESFEALSEELKTIKAFFPGGVVGKHAFFTLLENEIRNVKHFKDESLDEIRENGLVLNISIHPRPVDSLNPSTLGNYELLKIGVCLKHRVDIKANLLLDRIKNLDKDIITEKTFKARLGGNQQDKLCAAMLLTKTFDDAQDKQSPLGQIYYPWIKSVSTDYHSHPGYVEEFEISYRRYQNIDDEEFITAFKPISGWGYLKKYFHLWKGDEYLAVNKTVDFKSTQLENFSRYRFIHLSGLALNQKKEYQRNGVIRLLTDADLSGGNLINANLKWLSKWLISDSGISSVDTVIDIKEGETNAARLVFENGTARFENGEQIREAFFDDQLEKAYEAIPNRIEIIVEHGSQLTADVDKLNIRSHGELVRRFGQGKFPSQVKEMSTEDICELLETLGTRICLFDRRIYNRMVDSDSGRFENQKARLLAMRSSLRLHINDELEAIWSEQQKIGFLHQFNFLVIHLSFIESIKAKGEKETKYTEDRIIDFIDDQILKGVAPEDVPDSFVLVITTGRGRMAWWDKIGEYPEYARFTTFRPIESILGAVEDALQMPDEIDLKINLTKLLFGS